jgi:hypothetical protein
MMKKPKNLFILLVTAAVVWGLIVWRIVGYQRNKAPKTGLSLNQQKIGIEAKDRCLLILNYPDPFLGDKEALPIKFHQPLLAKGNVSNNQNSVNRLNIQIQRQENTHAKPIKDKINQTIAYKGLVKNSNDSKKLGILVVDGKELLIKQGDFVAGWWVALLAMNKVTLDDGNAIREIEKQ